MRSWTVGAALLFLLAATTVQADEPDETATEPDAKALERAKASYDKARALHEAGQYQKAAAAYLRSFSDYPDPELYFNAAQVYRLGGESALALGYYRRYLELDPSGRAADEAREHITTLSPEVEGIQKPGSAASQWGAPPDGPAGSSATASAQLTSSSPILRGSAIALTGVGAVAFGFAIAAGIEARGLGAELSTTERWTDERLARFSDGEAAERRATILTVVGAGAVVGAGVLWWLGGPTSGRAEAVAIVPSRDGFAVSAAGSF